MDMWRYEDYILGRQAHRTVGNALLAAAAFPLLHRALRGPANRLFGAHPGTTFLFDLWLPRHPAAALSLGALAGLLEHRHARVAWEEALITELEPVLWTARTVVPALAFFVNPWLAAKALDGELKGASAGFAFRERRPLQQWPFFAILDAARPSPEGGPLRYHCVNPEYVRLYGAAAVSVHLFLCRRTNGFYEVVRNPENAKWAVI